MKPEELRIGNYVIYEKTTHSITSLSSIYCTSLWVGDGCVYSHSYYEIEPIPITEEWLLKFGMDRQEDVERGFINYFISSMGFVSNYLVRYNIELDEYYLSHYYDNFFVNIKHLHQLQNLYFALTGDELIIKE